MKRSLVLGLFMVFVLTSGVFVIAQSDNEATVEIDVETEAEVEVMTESHGAEMRLLQLERRINRAILHMEEIIQFLKDKNKTITELEPIVAEMNILLEEVKAAPKTKSEESVKVFVEIKADAKDLIKQFRDISKALLSEEDKRELKMKFDNIDKTKLEEVKRRIEEKRRMLNADRAKKVLDRMNVSDEELIAKIRSGEVGSSQLKLRLLERYDGLDVSAKESIRIRMKEQFEQRRDTVVDHVKRVKEEHLERQSDRLKERADKLRREGYRVASEKVSVAAEKLKIRATTKVDAEVNAGVTG